MARSSWSGTRQSLPRSTRDRILKRDAHQCRICNGAKCGNRQLEVDHVTPVAEGGTDRDDNLQAVGAHPCHAAKTRAEQARGQARRSTRRKPERHPGIIR